MQVLSLAHFQSIEYIIKGGDYNYISAHLAVDIPEDASLFAKIQMNGNSAQWYVDESNAAYRPITTASEEDRLAALQDLKVRKARILQTLKQKNVPYAESLFIVPSEDQIFYSKTGSTTRALLCQWGFKKRNDISKHDTITFLLESVPDPPEPVNVRFVSKGSDGKALGPQPFKLDWVGVNMQDFITEEDGTYPLGKMMPGSSFSVLDDNGNKFPFTVAPGIFDYEAVIPIYASFAIKVANQDGDPKKAYKIAVGELEVMTDSEGMYKDARIELTSDSSITVFDETGHREVYRLERGDNAFTFLVTDKFYSSLLVHTQWNDGEIIPGAKVMVNGEEKESDNDGIIEMNDLEPGSCYTIYPSDNISDKQEIRLERGRNEVLIQKTKIPPKDVRIRLFDHKGNPLRNLHVRFKLASGPCEADTDEEGCIFIPETLFTDKEKVQFSFEYDDPGKKK